MENAQPAHGVRLDLDGPIGRIELDRPDRHNALGATEVAAVRDALRRVAKSDAVRVLVLSARGSETFCSGAALDQMQTGEMSGEIWDGMTSALAALPVPTIAAIGGNVYGGGAELALCCDLRIAPAGIRLSVPAAKLGVCYPAGGLTRYVRRIGLGPATRILVSAEELDGVELHRIGYLTHLAPAGQLDEVVEARAGAVAALAPLAVRSMKRLLLAAADGDVDAEEARTLVERCADSADLQEGLAAWRERRSPRFEGR